MKMQLLVATTTVSTEVSPCSKCFRTMTYCAESLSSEIVSSCDWSIATNKPWHPCEVREKRSCWREPVFSGFSTPRWPYIQVQVESDMLPGTRMYNHDLDADHGLRFAGRARPGLAAFRAQLTLCQCDERILVPRLAKCSG